MKKLIREIVKVVAVVAALMSANTAHAAPVKMRVLNWNAHLDEYNRPAVMYELKNIINTYSPDILCLQEMGNDIPWVHEQIKAIYPYKIHRYNYYDSRPNSLIDRKPIYGSAVAIWTKQQQISPWSEWIQKDAGGDRWNRHAVGCYIFASNRTAISLSNYHNTFNWGFQNGFYWANGEYQGMLKYAAALKKRWNPHYQWLICGDWNLPKRESLDAMLYYGFQYYPWRQSGHWLYQVHNDVDGAFSGLLINSWFLLDTNYSDHKPMIIDFTVPDP